MAKGDVVSDLVTLANLEVLDIRPPEGEEWVITNVYYGGEFYLIVVRGDLYEDCYHDVGSGVLAKFNFHLTHTQFLRIQNISVGSAQFGYDGMKTKCV